LAPAAAVGSRLEVGGGKKRIRRSEGEKLSGQRREIRGRRHKREKVRR